MPRLRPPDKAVFHRESIRWYETGAALPFDYNGQKNSIDR